MDRIKLQDSDGAERPATGPSDVGARLRAAREAKQITLREIAATTKISVSALEAVEQNDVTRLPGGIFTRAFVRAYANEVGLDAEETMRDYIEQVPPETVKEASRADLLADGYDEFKSQRRMAGTVMTLLVVGIPLAGGLLYLGTRDFTSVDEAAGRVVETQPAAVNESLAASESTVVALPVAGANESDDQGAVAELLSLVLQPTDDCWVSLTIDGVLIFSRVMQGGERESYQAGDEIVINIGDAGAFEFTINQRPGRSLGAPGEVVTARITPQHVGSFLVP